MIVAKYPIKEKLDAGEKEKLFKSLEKGNLTQVTFAKEGREEKMYVTANPQYKTLDVFNSKMEKQFQGVEKKEKESETMKEKKETQKQGVDEEGEPKKELKKSKGKSVGV